MAILEADALEKGPIARAWFDHHLPFTFHGAWAPARVR
ncbi:MAG TPA: carotenoid oxygenase family protein [Vulgatibacter sp.]|nr:carotenoid oxygenase family protein [Vulgatibacter sp.]